MKTRNSSEPEELIVIGVNSMFLTTDNSKDFEICEDVCKDYQWLDSLETLRKITAFGYIYCCEVNEDVTRKLDGFPIENNHITKENGDNAITKMRKDEEYSYEDVSSPSSYDDYNDIASR